MSLITSFARIYKEWMKHLLTGAIYGFESELLKKVRLNR